MKKSPIILICAVMALSSSCSKGEMSQGRDCPCPVLFAYKGADSKTVQNEDWTVSWSSSDRLTAFNAATGTTTYSDNCRFLISGNPSDGKFVKDDSEKTKKLITDKSAYDWYVCSPWMEYGSKPGGTKGYTVAMSPTQRGYNVRDHISQYDIMVGKAVNVPDGTAPKVSLKHVCALMKFTVTNDTDAPAAITGITLDAGDGGTFITGSFTMDWNALALDPTQMGSSSSYTVELTVVKNVGTDEKPVYTPTDETVAPGASVDLYVTTAPFTIPAGKSVRLTLKGSAGDVEIVRTFAKETAFAAGTYNVTALSYGNVTPGPGPDPDLKDVVFIETFGEQAVSYANFASYNKSGLKTGNPSDALAYAYAPYNNTSIQPCNTDAGGINNPNYSGTVLQGAAVKFPKATAAVFIKNIAVEANTTYVFEYNKSKGVNPDGTEFEASTLFEWRTAGTSTWTKVKETSDVGTVSQEFTTGEGVTMIDIGIQETSNTQSGTPKIYPAVDLFKLKKK